MVSKKDLPGDWGPQETIKTPESLPLISEMLQTLKIRTDENKGFTTLRVRNQRFLNER